MENKTNKEENIAHECNLLTNLLNPINAQNKK